MKRGHARKCERAAGHKQTLGWIGVRYSCNWWSQGKQKRELPRARDGDCVQSYEEGEKTRIPWHWLVRKVFCLQQRAASGQKMALPYASFLPQVFPK